MPALAIATARRDTLLFATVSGVRSDDADVAATVDDRFHIGSVAKPITATMIARLIERGRIRCETTPADVWPNQDHAFNAAVRRVTVEQLLAHRGGMPSFGQDDDFATRT